MKNKIFLLVVVLSASLVLSGCDAKTALDFLKKNAESDTYKNCMAEGRKIVIKENAKGETEITCEKDEVKQEEATTTEDMVTEEVKTEEEEVKIEEDTKTEEQQQAVVEKPKYALSGSATADGVKLAWSFSGVDVSQGYKIVKSTKENPVYPGNDYQYLSDPKTTSYVWKINDGVTYYFRVCQYLGGKCGVYTNNLKLTTVKKETTKTDTTTNYATGISLNASVDGTTVNFNWNISNGEAPLGYKLVVSPNPNPVYPGNEYKYFSDPNTKSYSWQNLKGNTAYNFRVCVYKGGSCGAYSENIAITTGASSEPSEPLATAINLSGSSANGKVNLSWNLVGGGSPLGYKVVMSENANPIYPGNLYHYLSSESTMSDMWDVDEVEIGKTYHFRTCVYLGGACGTYSNDVAVTVK